MSVKTAPLPRSLVWSTDDLVTQTAAGTDGAPAGVKIVRTPDNRWVVFRQRAGGWESPSDWGAFDTTAEAKEFAAGLPVINDESK